MKRLSFSVTVLAVLFAASLQAQMEMPKPGPELKKLDYFAGAWTSDLNVKPGPMGPGGKATSVDHSEWLDGGFFLVTHSDFKGAMGNGSGVAYIGYNADGKVYTDDEFDSAGGREHYTGTVDGDTWTWTGDEKMGAATKKGRFTMKILSPTSYSFKFEMSPDGAHWNTVMDGKATKTK